MLIGVIFIVKVNWKRKAGFLHCHFLNKTNLIEMTKKYIYIAAAIRRTYAYQTTVL